MKCNTCGVENDLDSLYCRHCGNIIKKQSVLEKYPEYHFLPSSLYKIKGELKYKFARIISIIAAIIGTIVCLHLCLDPYYHYWDENTIIGVLLIPVVISLIYFGFHYSNLSRNYDISNIVDYFEKTNINYAFIIKNEKFGVFDKRTGTVCIPIEYSSLSWKVQGKILNALCYGREFLIDINNNKLS